METSVTTPLAASNRDIGETVAPATTPTALLVPLATQAKRSAVAETWERVKASPHLRAARELVAGTPTFLAATTPAVVLAGVGYAVGAHNAHEGSQQFGWALGAMGGLLLTIPQFAGRLSLTETFARLGHRYPNLASCLNVTLCTALPSATLGLAAAHYAHGGWGVGAAVLGGILGAFFCDAVQTERVGDAAWAEARRKWESRPVVVVDVEARA